MEIKRAAFIKAALFISLKKLALRRFQQFKELIQLRQDHDAGAAVGSFTLHAVVTGYRQVLAAATGGHALGINMKLVLQDAHNRSSALGAQVPVVLDAGIFNWHIIGVAFYQELDLGFAVQHLRYFTQHFISAVAYIIRAALEQQ